MEIVLNGERREVERGASLADVLTAAGMPERGVAVAVDGDVVPRASWPAHVPAEGAQVEVLTAVQGG